MVREVHLFRDKGIALVDDEDFDAVMARRWHVGGSPRNHTKYAQTNVKGEDGKWRILALHRFIMKPPPGLQVDHINRNGLDCRRCNLRWATPSQNRVNSRKKPSKTGLIGVQPSHHGRFIAMVGAGNMSFHAGTFDDPIEAARARDALAVELHGEFAVLNFPDAEAA